MPNSTKAEGTPLQNAIKGFDRPEDLFGVEEDGRLVFFGYQDAAERFCQDKGKFIFQAKPLAVVQHEIKQKEVLQRMQLSKSTLYGYRKPTEDGLGKRWCNCTVPTLTSLVGDAYCLRCCSYHYK